jgi:hypothetical protein
VKRYLILFNDNAEEELTFSSSNEFFGIIFCIDERILNWKIIIPKAIIAVLQLYYDWNFFKAFKAL